MKTKQNTLFYELKDDINIFKLIFENTIDGILIADEEKNIVLVNKTMCKMLGYTNDELLKKNISDIHPIEKLQYVSEQFENQFKKSKKITIEVPVLRKDKSVFFAEIGAYPIIIDKSPYLVGYFRDITERKQLTEELVSSEEKFRNIIQSSPMGIHIYKRNRNI